MGRNSSGISGSKRGQSTYMKATDNMIKAFNSGNAEMKKASIAKVRELISKMGDDTVAARAESTSEGAWLSSKAMNPKGYDPKQYAYNSQLAKLYAAEAKKRKLAGYK